MILAAMTGQVSVAENQPAVTVPPELDSSTAADVQGTLAELLPSGGASPSPAGAPMNATGLNVTLLGGDGNLEAPEAVDVAALTEQAVSEAAAGVDENTRAALAAQAQGRFATAAGLEARAAKAELRSARTWANTSDALLIARARRDYIETASAEIRSSAAIAAKYAHRAHKAEVRAQEELREIEAAPQIAVATAASAAAGSFLAKVQKEEAEESAFELLPPESLAPPLNTHASGDTGDTGPDFVPVG